MTEDRVDWNLWNWARIVSASRESGSWYPSRSSGGIENYKSSGDSDEDYDAACKQWAYATDAAIDDLPTIYKQAVYAQLMQGPWEHEEIALGIHYRAAFPMIAKGLQRRGVV